MLDSRAVDCYELPLQQLLSELAEPLVGDVTDTLVVEEADQWLVVDLHEQVRTTKRVVPKLLQPIVDSKTFTFNWNIVGLGLRTKAGFNATKRPTIVTAGEGDAFTVTLLLPIPIFDQSVDSKVTALGVNVLTPSMTCSTMIFFASSNATCRSAVQANSDLGDRSSLNGAMTAVLEKAKETCSTRPKKERISVMFAGLGNPVMACNVSGEGLMESSPNQNPTNSNSF